MALMGKLRDKTHIVLFILVAAFVGLIVFEWGMNFTGPKQSRGGDVGAVNGEPIPAAEYEQLYNMVSTSFRQRNPGVEVTSRIDAGLREQAWNMVVDQTLINQLLKKYAVQVSDQEVLEAVNSEVNPPGIIRQNFTDPKTGQIDRELLEKARQDPQAKEFWLKAQEMVRRELMINKLLMDLKSMAIVTDPEVTELVQRQYTTFSGSFIPFPYDFAGPASNFPVKDEEITAWYEAHKGQFQQEPTRSAEFVFFPLTPSAQDSLRAKKEIDGLVSEFASAPDEAEFVKIQSDIPDAVNVTRTRADFSLEGGKKIFDSPKLAPGQIVGPVADQGYYRLLKIKSVSTGEPMASASHILIRVNPADKASVESGQALARKILDELKNGASFAQLAAKYSQDPGNAQRGGFLGWFTKERMVPEFTQAVFSGKPGQVVGPVLTRFGLHIIKIDGFDNRQIVCSEVVRQLKPSSLTSESIKRKAMVFRDDAESKGFAETAKLQKLDVVQTGDFTRQTLVSKLGMDEDVASFAFSSKDGAISQVIKNDNGFVVMKLLTKNDTGYRLLDDELKEMIKAELVREKQGTALKAKLAELSKSSGGSLDAIVQSNPGLRKITSGIISWRDGNIDGYGSDRRLVEAMAGMELNKLSAPVQTSNGFALVKLDGRQLPYGLDLEVEKKRILPQLMKIKQEQLFNEYFEAARRTAKIEDNR
ncbi:PpiC-type peptidyl-prolyl cis-trans isomerase [Chlorobaculum parvum NCIB 8327]|uniref:PpiC-type peptidyl-prolyl cis-trans isomerase n=2 Tax=Chlorobaculum parvum TaxID=274539 RepID=B3QQM0_CHLP8|nr:PpiC-type peptidyl-prolyl cis-trans isomerase [Chlorobaculum parvum NCIB 8327]